MAQQMDMNDFIRSDVKDKTRSLIERFFQEGQDAQTLPGCRNRHEGYGLLCEAFTALSGAMDGVKAGMKDCLKMLSGEDHGFTSAAEETYSGVVDLAIAGVRMGVQAMNIVCQMMDKIQSTPLPLEEYIQDAEGGVASEDDTEDVPEVPDTDEE